VGVGEFLRRNMTVSDWSIGVADLKLEDLVGSAQPVDRNVFRPSVRWLPRPWFVRVQADQCLVEHEGRFFLYYEEMVFGSGKGRLRWVELNADGTPGGQPASMLDDRAHAAYPYVFKHANAFYCVPETGPRNRVTLYSSDTPLGPWREHGTLLKGVSARDSTLVLFHGRWWLFCTVADSDPRAQQTGLHIWHAAEPWGPWQPHRLQPAKSDIHSARPAGRPFTVDGVLYRPAQDCWPRYGMRTVINRVLALTPDDFAEEVCAYIEPDPRGSHREGLHTLASAGGLVLVDGCHMAPTLNPLKILMTAAPRVRQRLRGRAGDR
jgi:hypothetical protein